MRYGSVQNAEIHLFCSENRNFLIKICDRLANIQYTMMFVFANRMLDVYRREYPEFIRSISEGAVTQVPDAMKEEAERLLNSESYII